MSGVPETWRLMAVVVLGLTVPAFTAARAQTTFPAASPAEPAAVKDDVPDAVTVDQAITLLIKDQMQTDRRFRHSQVVVETSGGVVTLLGTMPTAYALSAALDVARKTPGVVDVQSYLRLLGSSPQAPMPP